jgi:hypothetical protein
MLGVANFNGISGLPPEQFDRSSCDPAAGTPLPVRPTAVPRPRGRHFPLAAALLLLLGSVAAGRAQSNYLVALTNQVNAMKAQPGWVEPDRTPQTFTLATNPISDLPSPISEVEAPSAAAARWLQLRYAPGRWHGVQWYVEGRFLVPVEIATGLAPGMTVPLAGYIPKDENSRWTRPLPPPCASWRGSIPTTSTRRCSSPSR